MNRIDFNREAAERITKSLRDRGYKAEGKIAVKTLEPSAPAQVGAPAEGQPFEITSWATRNTIDMEGEVVIPEGGDVASYFAKNRNLFVDHEYDIMKAVAKARWLKMTPGGWLVRGALINNRENGDGARLRSRLDEAGGGDRVRIQVLESRREPLRLMSSGGGDVRTKERDPDHATVFYSGILDRGNRR